MNFALIGAAGYVAPRHMRAIRDTRHCLLAAVDPHANVGILDGFAPDCQFFTEIERFDRFLALRARGPSLERVHMVSVCSPNYLHDAHIRLALRSGADAICEKPIVINPWNLDALVELERETERRVWTVLQLRLHSALRGLREIAADGHHTVTLTYVTPRGRWYDASWKGSEEQSGGVAMNIGVHLFDLLLWLFGPMRAFSIETAAPHHLDGLLELERASVQWLLSIDAADLPEHVAGPSYRSLVVDGKAVDMSRGFEDLHTQVYQATLDGAGWGLEEARPAIELTYALRQAARVCAYCGGQRGTAHDRPRLILAED